MANYDPFFGVKTKKKKQVRFLFINTDAPIFIVCKGGHIQFPHMDTTFGQLNWRSRF